MILKFLVYFCASFSLFYFIFYSAYILTNGNMICRHVYDRHNMIVILSTLVGQGMLNRIEIVNILF